VKVEFVTEELSAVNIGSHTVVCVTDSNNEEYERTNILCREHGIKFFAANTWGMAGFLFLDCGDRYCYVAEKPNVMKGKTSDKPDTKRQKLDDDGSGDEWEQRTAHFTLFNNESIPVSKYKNTSPSVIIAKGKLSGAEDLSGYCKTLTEKFGCKGVSEDLLNNVEGELVPICAVIGGMVGQEIVKIVSGKDDPIVNSLFYDG